MKRSNKGTYRPGYKPRFLDRLAVAFSGMLYESVEYVMVYGVAFVVPAGFAVMILTFNGSAMFGVIGGLLAVPFIAEWRATRRKNSLTSSSDYLPLPENDENITQLITALNTADTLQSSLRTEAIREGEDLLYSIAVTARDKNKLEKMNTVQLTEETFNLREQTLKQIDITEKRNIEHAQSLITAINAAAEQERIADNSAERNIILAAAETAALNAAPNPNHQTIPLLSTYSNTLDNLNSGTLKPNRQNN